MDKNKYQSIYEIFSNWTENNVVTKKKSFSEIKCEFLEFLKFNRIDEYLKLIENTNIDLIMIDWICLLVDTKILIKEDSEKGIKYIYNPDKLNEAQKTIIKKHNIKKKIIFICIILLIILIIGIFIFLQINEENEKRKRQEKIAQEEKNVAEEIVREFKEEYYLEDLEYDHIEIGTLDAIVYYKSDLFDRLSDENKILFITSIEQKTRLKKVFPRGSKAASLYYDLVIISRGHKYKDFTSSGKSWLIKDGTRVFAMETEYAKDVEESLKRSISTSSSNKSTSSSSKKYYSVQRNYSGCYPSKPHYVCYEQGRCRCVRSVSY